MKIVGITLFWVGIVMLLRNIGFIQDVNSTLVWGVVLIVIGTTLKHGCHHGMCGMGKWKMMGKGGEMEGGKCDMCGK